MGRSWRCNDCFDVRISGPYHAIVPRDNTSSYDVELVGTSIIVVCAGEHGLEAYLATILWNIWARVLKAVA